MCDTKTEIKKRANATTGMRKRAKSKILFFAEVRPYKFMCNEVFIFTMFRADYFSGYYAELSKPSKREVTYLSHCTKVINLSFLVLTSTLSGDIIVT